MHKQNACTNTLCDIMAHEYNDIILYIVSSPCSHALVKVEHADLHKLEA